ncbi:MAG: 2-hydroxyacid dehydrogenase, partial [Clostridia bacterium]|nr:2-hydroxyacid dehydrogenase [Clostridia bacterium]
CLDVYEEESDLFFEDNSGHIMEDDTLARLISMPNVLVTSHQAFLTEEALENIAETTINNIVTFFKNGQCKNELCYRCGNAEDCKDGKCF